jgi:hypothetical protein
MATALARVLRRREKTESMLTINPQRFVLLTVQIARRATRRRGPRSVKFEISVRAFEADISFQPFPSMVTGEHASVPRGKFAYELETR